MRWLASLPSRERGLKFNSCLTPIWNFSVAPFAGAWIEICTPRYKNIYCWVAPFAGAWIEIKVAPSSGILVSLSLPSRERGLKFDVDIAIRGYGCVAPFAGAWIEMQQVQGSDR